MKNELLGLNLEVEETNNIVNDISSLIEESRHIAYQAVDVVLLKRNWLIGKRICEEELKETRKENYGQEIIVNLAKGLTQKYGDGFSIPVLYSFKKFYTLYKNIFSTLWRESFLSWSHYKILISISDKNERNWYEKEALECRWSVRTLQRNIKTLYYYRIINSKFKEPVKREMEEKTIDYQNDKYEHIKNPVFLEFIEVPKNDTLYENKLESLIINNLQMMLMELGKGYAFIGRQYRIHTEENDYYVDLVFYNYILKCFVLIDLKVGQITHQDVGQMDMYVKMFDELIKSEDDNPTLGIILCSDTSKDIAKYSILKGNEQLFASKYKLYLPDEKKLKEEIEYQKYLFEMSRK